MPQPPAPPPVPRWLMVAIVAFGLLVVSLVGMTLRRPELVTYAPTPVEPRPPVTFLTGPEVVTIDARDAQRWRYFSFARGSVVEEPAPIDWDIALRRFQVMVNGGAGFAGAGGAVHLDDAAFEDVRILPADGYLAASVRGDSLNPALRRWYSYSYTSHLLTPRPQVYALRTADGRYAKLQFIGYYCPGADPGCVTIRYVFQGAGGLALTDGSAP